MVLPLLALAAAGGPIGIAAAALGAVGSIVGGIGQNNAAKARARALEMQAQQARNEAGVAAQMGLMDDDRLAGHAATLQAANGGGFSGSAMDVLNDLRQQSIFKAKTTVYRGESQARNDLYEAKVSRQSGTNALISSGVNAASSLLGSFAQAAQLKSLAGAGSSAGGGGSGAATASSAAGPFGG